MADQKRAGAARSTGGQYADHLRLDERLSNRCSHRGAGLACAVCTPVRLYGSLACSSWRRVQRRHIDHLSRQDQVWIGDAIVTGHADRHLIELRRTGAAPGLGELQMTRDDA